MKNLLLIALALFMFVACSKSEIDEDPQPEPVEEKNFAHYLKGPYPDSIFTLPKYTTIKFAVAYHIKDNEISNNGFYLKEKVAKKINEKYWIVSQSIELTKKSDTLRYETELAKYFNDGDSAYFIAYLARKKESGSFEIMAADTFIVKIKPK